MLQNLLHRQQPHFVLLFGDDGVLCSARNLPNNLLLGPIFARHGDVKDETRILDMIAQYLDFPVTIFLDILAQDFRHETVPTMSWFDRRRLVARRLAQAFPNSILRKSRALSATSCLLIGVHGHESLMVWIEKLRRYAPSIALLPYECVPLIDRLLPEKNDDWALLVSINEVGGVRQIMTHNGQLVFTRLTPPLPTHASSDECAETLARDIAASRGYMGRFGLNDDVVLNIVAIVPHYIGAALATQMPMQNKLTRYSPYDAAAKLNLTHDMVKDTVFADMLYVAWIAQHPVRMRLWLPQARAVRLEKIRAHALSLAAVMTACCTCLVVGWKITGMLLSLSALHDVQGDIARIDSNIIVERQKMPANQPLGRLRTAVERQRLYSDPVTNPWNVVSGLAKGMSDAARLQRMEWQNVTGKDQAESVNITLRLLTVPPSASRSGHDDAVQAVANNLAAQMPHYAVDVTRFPFPQAADETIAGSDSAVARKSTAVTAEMTLKKIMP